ncbi:hypothetical protein Daura_38795 [Dactylosporangium aurantiacum]|uniref:Uncharacterized protein n=1 Tax=Dactylosporangium aurantiacum TaxID=35754 RepID=A0A9Q9IB69_9ACTN|nr:hypothetical protein [Dactylosporangium aurantiacum]MDG6101629.1 hypothetical protein [Dactylosporangium aurantiacum]UWZ52546.1 hypothetical protein Daura_38795 [Dactylosporangium aurantiacum]
MRRADLVWWVLLGAGSAFAAAMFMLDKTPPHLLFAVLPAFGIAATLSRSWLRARSSHSRGR